MTLPNSHLPVHRLKAAFANTSATYKFYWLLAILDAVEQGRVNIPKHELFARMLANAWYTVNYFRVSFGPQDLIQKTIQEIAAREALSITLKKEAIVQRLLNSKHLATRQQLQHFDKNVPHWFLSAWFPHAKGSTDTGRRRYIYEASQEYGNESLYALHPSHIVVNAGWLPYLQAHVAVIRDFVYWNLALFLQARNPNVPAIADKLIRPVVRNSLTRQRKQYWDIVFRERGTIHCIFTQTRLDPASYALDHFIPHAFVSHDLIWNLIPIDKTFNSAKSDRLPDLDRYFDPFFTLQHEAYHIIQTVAPQSKLLDDYHTIFPTLPQTGFNKARFYENIMPLVKMAGNNGFVGM